MEITPETRTITNYTVILTDADAQQLLADPYSFSERLRNSLLPHVPQVAGAPTHKPGKASQITVGRGAPNGKRKAAAKPKTPKAAKGAKLPVVTCPECGKTLAAKFLPRHMAAKHDAASSPAASAAE